MRDLPLQTDATHRVISSNQCSWAAHEFAFHAPTLRASILASDLSEFRRVYSACLLRASELRRDKGDAALVSMGENIDSKAVREHYLGLAGAGGFALDSDVLACVTDAGAMATTEALASMAGPVGRIAFAQIAPDRKSVQCIPNRDDGLSIFEASLTSLPPSSGYMVVERNGKSLAVLRMGGEDSFLVVDSHCSECAVAPLAAVRDYILMEGDHLPPEITWCTGTSGNM